jgi:hypothetical protein
MDNPFSKKNIIIGSVIVVVAFAVYQVVFVAGNNTNDSAVLIVDSGAQSSEERDILLILSDLRSIDLSRDVLEDRLFLSLEDYTTTIVQGPKGRKNPFAPVGVDGGVPAPVLGEDE